MNRSEKEPIHAVLGRIAVEICLDGKYFKIFQNIIDNL